MAKKHDLIPVSGHHRKRPQRRPAAAPMSPMPGQNEFDADQEQQMRRGVRASLGGAQSAGDDDDVGLGGL
jgi:hypothetical protein